MKAAGLLKLLFNRTAKPTTTTPIKSKTTQSFEAQLLSSAETLVQEKSTKTQPAANKSTLPLKDVVQTYSNASEAETVKTKASTSKSDASIADARLVTKKETASDTSVIAATIALPTSTVSLPPEKKSSLLKSFFSFNTDAKKENTQPTEAQNSLPVISKKTEGSDGKKQAVIQASKETTSVVNQQSSVSKKQVETGTVQTQASQVNKASDSIKNSSSNPNNSPVVAKSTETQSVPTSQRYVDTPHAIQAKAPELQSVLKTQSNSPSQGVRATEVSAENRSDKVSGQQDVTRSSRFQKFWQSFVDPIKHTFQTEKVAVESVPVKEKQIVSSAATNAENRKVAADSVTATNELNLKQPSDSKISKPIIIQAASENKKSLPSDKKEQKVVPETKAFNASLKETQTVAEQKPQTNLQQPIHTEQTAKSEQTDNVRVEPKSFWGMKVETSPKTADVNKVASTSQVSEPKVSVENNVTASEKPVGVKTVASDNVIGNDKQVSEKAKEQKVINPSPEKKDVTANRPVVTTAKEQISPRTSQETQAASTELKSPDRFANSKSTPASRDKNVNTAQDTPLSKPTYVASNTVNETAASLQKQNITHTRNPVAGARNETIQAQTKILADKAANEIKQATATTVETPIVNNKQESSVRQTGEQRSKVVASVPNRAENVSQTTATSSSIANKPPFFSREVQTEKNIFTARTNDIRTNESPKSAIQSQPTVAKPLTNRMENATDNAVKAAINKPSPAAKETVASVATESKKPSTTNIVNKNNDEANTAIRSDYKNTSPVQTPIMNRESSVKTSTLSSAASVPVVEQTSENKTKESNPLSLSRNSATESRINFSRFARNIVETESNQNRAQAAIGISNLTTPVIVADSFRATPAVIIERNPEKRTDSIRDSKTIKSSLETPQTTATTEKAQKAAIDLAALGIVNETSPLLGKQSVFTPEREKTRQTVFEKKERKVTQEVSGQKSENGNVAANSTLQSQTSVNENKSTVAPTNETTRKARENERSEQLNQLTQDPGVNKTETGRQNVNNSTTFARANGNTPLNPALFQTQNDLIKTPVKQAQDLTVNVVQVASDTNATKKVENPSNKFQNSGNENRSFEKENNNGNNGAAIVHSKTNDPDSAQKAGETVHEIQQTRTDQVNTSDTSSMTQFKTAMDDVSVPVTGSIALRFTADQIRELQEMVNKALQSSQAMQSDAPEAHFNWNSPEFGALRFKIATHDNEVSVQIASSRQEVVDTLEQSKAVVERIFFDQGLKIEKFEIQYRSDNPSSHTNATEQRSDGNGFNREKMTEQTASQDNGSFIHLDTPETKPAERPLFSGKREWVA